MAVQSTLDKPAVAQLQGVEDGMQVPVRGQMYSLSLLHVARLGQLDASAELPHLANTF